MQGLLTLLGQQCSHQQSHCCFLFYDWSKKSNVRSPDIIQTTNYQWLMKPSLARADRCYGPPFWWHDTVGGQQVVSSGTGTMLEGSWHRDHQHRVASSRRWHNCRCASQFQSRNKYKHVISLDDVDGNVSSKVVMRGWLNTMSHQSILASLSHHARRSFQACSTSTLDGHNAWSLNKTGMIATDKKLFVGNNLYVSMKYNKMR